jgi:hypothetical protein
MNNNIAPGALAAMGGGALVFIASFLKWTEGLNGLETSRFGLQGIFVLLLGAGVAGLVAARTFGNVKLPDSLLGLSFNQLIIADGLAAFVILFGAQFAEGAKIGATLGWIGAIAIVAGGILEMQGEGSGSSSGPTSF